MIPIIILLVMSALPYGTVEPWWEALLVAIIFTIGIVTIGIDAYQGQPLFHSRKVTLPLIALGVFALLQSFNLPPFVSLDSEATRLVAYQIFSFAIYIELIHRACAERRSLTSLLWAVIGVGIASSIFGILRVIAFGGSGEFFLDGLKPGIGFAQFINQNHFAMLASASAGAAFVLVLGERSKQKKLILLAAFLVPMAALVFSLSRGAIFAFVVQAGAVVSLRSLGSLGSRESRESLGRRKQEEGRGGADPGAQASLPAMSASARTDEREEDLTDESQTDESETQDEDTPDSGLTRITQSTRIKKEIGKGNKKEIGNRKASKAKSHSLPTRIAQIAIAIAMFATILWGISWIGDEKLALRIEKLPDQIEVTDADRGLDRTNAWKGAIELFKEFPVFGSGFGAFKNGITRHLNYSGEMRWEQAHNDYLEFLAAGGLVGLGLGIWFLIRIFKITRQNLSTDDRRTKTLRYAAMVGIVGIAVHSVVDFGLHTMINSMVLLSLLGVLTVEVEAADPRRTVRP